MKKLMLTIAGLLFVSVMAVHAQVPQEQDKEKPAPEMAQDPAAYTKDMVVIQATEVPEVLRNTLKDAEYTGWEEGKLYRNNTTSEYLIIIGEENAKVFRFDAQGKRIENLNESGSGSSEAAPSPAPAPKPEEPTPTK